MPVIEKDSAALAPLADASLQNRPELRLIMDVFHGTTSGKNGEILQSFHNRGISPDNFSNGHGQSKGFYVWTTMEKAREHALDIKGDKFSKNGTTEGAPIVVKASIVLDPKTWDFDVEAHRGLTTIFLNSLLKRNGNVLQLEEADGRKIVLRGSDTRPSNFIARLPEGRTHGFEAGSDGANIGTGELLGRIVAAVRASEFASLWHDYFAQTVSSMADMGLALKYFGNQSLPIQQIVAISKQVNES